MVLLGQSYKVKIRSYIYNFDTIYSDRANISKDENDNLNFFMNNITKYDSRPVILRLSEPIVSIIRVFEFEKIKKKLKRYIEYFKIFFCTKKNI